jgi:hypothetical protein
MCYTAAMDGVIGDPEGIWRRTDLQLQQDQEQATVLALQGHTHEEIAQLINEKRNYSISRSMVSADLKRAKEMMVDQFQQRMQVAFSMEMKRLDIAEQIAWRAFRRLDEEGALSEEVVEQLVQEDKMDEEGRTKMVETSRRKFTNYASPILIGWFNKIMDIQKERRRILRMYAPDNVTLIQANNVEVPVKAYMGFDPGSWPQAKQIVEGESDG